MEKAIRLSLIRSASKRNVSLSPEAASILEQLRKEDPDLGIRDAVGDLSGDNEGERSAVVTLRTEDEENDVNLREISPMMRRAFD